MTILDRQNERLQRELHADVIRFRAREDRSATEEAMRWYAATRNRREGAQSCSVAHHGSPSSEAHRDRSQATYAALVACMVPVHEADDLDARYGTLQACVGAMLQARATEELIDRMCGYYIQGAERSQQWLADRLQMSPRTLSRHMERLENVMAKRFRFRGLI